MSQQLKSRPCKVCQGIFHPVRPLQVVCSPACARDKVKADRKAERENFKSRKEAIKTIPQLIREAQTAFNAFIRARDKDKPCICCGQPLGSGDVGGAYDAGHYRSTGSASHLRFHEDNVWAQRKICNRWGAGRAVDYRIGLIQRIGLERVEALESNNTPHKWTAEELREIKLIYQAKRKELEREICSGN